MMNPFGHEIKTENVFISDYTVACVVCGLLNATVFIAPYRQALVSSLYTRGMYEFSCFIGTSWGHCYDCEHDWEIMRW